jgi:hypothetical protein
MGAVHLWRWRYTDQFEKRKVYPCALSEENGRHLRDPEKIEGTDEVHQRATARTSWDR